MQWPLAPEGVLACSRPLSGIVAPILQEHLDALLMQLRASFGPTAACLDATAASGAGKQTRPCMPASLVEPNAITAGSSP